MAHRLVDVHEYNRGATLIPTSAHPLTGKSAPLILGHEISGVVVEVGGEAKDVKLNDKVVVQPILPDGVCAACRDGRINTCADKGFIGLSMLKLESSQPADFY